MYDVIMSCKSCSQDVTWMLQTVLVSSTGSMVLDQVPIDIRPLQNWMSVYSTRSGGEVIPPPGTPSLLSGWTQIPSTAAKLNILVHGYSVSEQDATTTFFPQWFKRLYWAGQPMILPQKGSPHTVGFSWYGNVSVINWPDDEFSALETGVPFANFLAQVADPAKTSNPVTVNIVAHSLGNMVVHSALIRPEVSGVISNHSILSYVMKQGGVLVVDVRYVVLFERCQCSSGGTGDKYRCLSTRSWLAGGLARGSGNTSSSGPMVRNLKFPYLRHLATTAVCIALDSAKVHTKSLRVH